MSKKLSESLFVPEVGVFIYLAVSLIQNGLFFSWSRDALFILEGQIVVLAFITADITQELVERVKARVQNNPR